MPAILSRTSPLVWTTSAWGCPATNPASPQSGPDASVELQALLDLGQSSALTVIVDQPLRVGGLKLYTGTTLSGLYRGSFFPTGGATVPTVGLFWRGISSNPADPSYTNDSLVTNANRFTGYNAASPASSSMFCSGITDQDITIRDIHIDGLKRVTGQWVPTNPHGTNPILAGGVGYSLAVVWIYGCRGFRMENVSIYDPPSFHTRFGNLDHAWFKDILLCDPAYFQGTFGGQNHTDGLHFHGPWNDLFIEDIAGTTGDDFVALNACDAQMQSGGNPVKFPVTYYGHGLRTHIRGLSPWNCADVLRIMIGYDVPNNCVNNKNRVEGLVVADVSGQVVQGGMQCNKYGTAGVGDTIAGVQLTNWDLTITAQGGQSGVVGMQIGQNFTDITIKDMKFRDVQNNAISHQVNLNSTANGGRLVIDGLTIREDASEVAAPLPAVAVSGGTVDELIIRNSGWFRNASTNLAFAAVTGGTVNRLSMENVACKNLGNLLSFTGGTINQVNSGPISHRNANTTTAGGAAINVGTGMTLPLLTAVGSDTAALLGTSAGTVTTLKTDGTERGA